MRFAGTQRTHGYCNAIGEAEASPRRSRVLDRLVHLLPAATHAAIAVGKTSWKIISMHCSIYKGSRRPDTYLFVPLRDDFSGVSDEAMKALGRLEHVMDLVLTPDRRLARSDARKVLRSLLARGCYIQLPPKDDTLPPG